MRLYWGLIAAMAAGMSGCSSEPELTGPVALVDEVCALVEQTHYDVKLHNKNWHLICNRYRYLVQRAESRKQALGHIDTMLTELGDSHCGFGDLSGTLRESSPYIFGEGSLGLDLRLIDGVAVFTRVARDSPAEAAGLRPGFTLVAIDGEEVRQIVRGARKRPPFTLANHKFYETQAILWRLFGEPGSAVSLECLDEAGALHTAELEFQVRSGGVSLFPPLPPAFFEQEERVFDGGVAYFRFSAFQPDEPALILAAIDKLDPQTPLVIDLRGNNGGSANATSAILRRFVRSPLLAYERVGRGQTIPVRIEPLKDGHRGEVVILVDEMSISAAENFAAVMRNAGRALLVGHRTPGQLLWGEAHPLGDNLFALIPTAQIVHPGAPQIESRGVIPDLEVALDCEALLHGRDTQLTAALNLLGGTNQQ